MNLNPLWSAVEQAPQICASGVPTGNGELTKSHVLPMAKYVIHWPTSNYDSYILVPIFYFIKDTKELIA